MEPELCQHDFFFFFLGGGGGCSAFGALLDNIPPHASNEPTPCFQQTTEAERASLEDDFFFFLSFAIFVTACRRLGGYGAT